MKLPFSLFLAFKYLKPHRSFVSIVTMISMFGVTIGVAVLIVVLSVMTGFDEVWRERILSSTPHVKIVQEGVLSNPDWVIKKVEKIKGVKGAAPCLEGLVLIQQDKEVFTPVLYGVDPNVEGKVSKVPSKMVAGQFAVEDDQIVIGRDLARRMNVWVGDVLTVFSPSSLSTEDEIQLPEELTISGIFQIGMYNYDVGFVFTSLETARSLYGVESPAVHAVHVMLDDPMQAPRLAQKMYTTLGNSFYSRTWMEMNQQIFAALHVEKNMMFFLLAFVALVAAFSITNTLITLTIQKTREIGLLRSLGFSSQGITGIFFWMGLLQGIIGNLLGVGLGLLILKYRNELLIFMSNKFNLELLPPELYQLSKLPSHTLGSDVGIVCGLVLIFCMFAGLVPALRAARMEPIDALRYE